MAGGAVYSNDDKSIIIGVPQTEATNFKPLAQVPSVAGGAPKAGKRIVVTEPEYAGTDVCHSLYLPINFEERKKHPLIVEYAGNYHPASGSTGRVEDAHLGFSLTLGRDFIWLVLPFVSNDGRHNEVTWWGDEVATVAYAKKCIPRVIEQFNGDPNAVILCGFSRGSIAVSYIGLHDDEIARLWSGFVTSDHFDGVLEWKGTSWGYPLAHYREEAVARLRRVHGRPFCVNQNGSVDVIRSFLESGGLLANEKYTLQAVPMKQFFPTVPNPYFKAYHTDLWPLFDTPCGRNARQWLSRWLAPRGNEKTGPSNATFP